jgi:hypothetical protein
MERRRIAPRLGQDGQVNRHGSTGSGVSAALAPNVPGSVARSLTCLGQKRRAAFACGGCWSFKCDSATSPLSTPCTSFWQAGSAVEGGHRLPWSCPDNASGFHSRCVFACLLSLRPRFGGCLGSVVWSAAVALLRRFSLAVSLLPRC